MIFQKLLSGRKAVRGGLRQGVRIREIRENERGGAKLRIVVWLACVGVIVFVCIKVVPPYYHNYMLQDWMNTEMDNLEGHYIGKEDALKMKIMEEIATEGVPATMDDIHILQNNVNGLNVEVVYDENVDLSVTQMKLHFTASKNSQSLVQSGK
jgi:hypothetical protein